MTRSLPSLKAQQAFEAVARLGSVQAAADELSLTSGAISRQIKSLEEDLGTALLRRDGRGVRLTEAGASLSRVLEPAFAGIAEAIEGARRRAGGDTVQLRALSSFATGWLISRLDRFRRIAPGIEVAVGLYPPYESASASDADLVVDWGRPGDFDRVVADKIADEEIFPVCGPRTAERIALSGGLAGATFLHYADVPPEVDWPEWPEFLAAVGLGGIDAGSGPRLTAGELILNAAREDHGVMLSNTTLAHDDLAAGRLVRPVPESLLSESGYCLLTPETRVGEPAVAAFRDWLLTEAASCFGSEDRPGGEVAAADPGGDAVRVPEKGPGHRAANGPSASGGA